ncbi:general secretion pathway protein N [Rhodanobacter sp. ANJX3]|jgi:general secretion pathway protein N|uniref:general secretion pathway protein GspN n=1 Tax=unclassified Rhodanobacter TaxID=2621553 RepID=UPI0015C910B7|nr:MULTISPECIES: general secretion pathway protein GspN [unclassified Rhodanobacter]MBB5359403.1 general secretion pathway protein N [Rhodanobacter sp. ANJX3]NYE29844.1 general secretion pathway protein N [Rhodanobacter sp. K2T2]
MNAASQRRLTPVLAGIVVVLGIALVALMSGLGRKVHWDEARPPVALPPSTDATHLPTPLPLESFALVWQKPLFTPDRKPIARVADGGTSLGDLSLTGIILTSGLRMALLHDKNGDRQIRLREGEALPDGSVKLVEVRPRSALFDASGGRTELKLPAGAPIDEPKGAAPALANGDANANGAQVPAGSVMTIAPPRPYGNPPANAPTESPLIDRIRQANQRRRAQNAASH